MKTISNNDKLVIWLVLSVLSFAAVGVIAGKLQVDYINSNQQYSYTLQSVPDQEKDKMITYGIAGAAVGLILGIINAGYRSNNKGGHTENR